MFSLCKSIQPPLSPVFARRDGGNCVQWLSRADTAGFRLITSFGFNAHLSSHLMLDPRSFEIHGAISIKTEGFGNAFLLPL